MQMLGTFPRSEIKRGCRSVDGMDSFLVRRRPSIEVVAQPASHTEHDFTGESEDNLRICSSFPLGLA